MALDLGRVNKSLLSSNGKTAVNANKTKMAKSASSNSSSSTSTPKATYKMPQSLASRNNTGKLMAKKLTKKIDMGTTSYERAQRASSMSSAQQKKEQLRARKGSSTAKGSTTSSGTGTK